MAELVDACAMSYQLLLFVGCCSVTFFDEIR
jgi:hypothetical protein